MTNSQDSTTVSYGFKRIAFIAALLWIAIWAYVAWRGLSLITDAKRFISLQPPGGLIPQEILSALEIGQSYVFRAVIFGAVVPVVLLIGCWVYRGFGRAKGH